MSFLTFRHSCVSETVDGDSLGILGGGGGRSLPTLYRKVPASPPGFCCFADLNSWV